MSLSSKERKKLSGLAHSLSPVVQVGKNGLTEEIVRAVNNELDHHELIKIKFIQQKSLKKEIIGEISSLLQAEVVRTVGNICILYRMNPDPEKRTISL